MTGSTIHLLDDEYEYGAHCPRCGFALAWIPGTAFQSSDLRKKPGFWRARETGIGCRPGWRPGEGFESVPNVGEHLSPVPDLTNPQEVEAWLST